jgi:hypothetical protein
LYPETKEGRNPMKHAVPFITLCVILTGACLGGDNPLVGTWEFVSGKFQREGSEAVTFTQAERKAFKIFNATHYSIVARDPHQNFGHAGRYSLKGNVYTEICEVSSIKDVMGQTYKFKSEIDGDTWRMWGEMPNRKLKLEEVWHRVKPR